MKKTFEFFQELILFIMDDSQINEELRESLTDYLNEILMKVTSMKFGQDDKIDEKREYEEIENEKSDTEMSETEKSIKSVKKVQNNNIEVNQMSETDNSSLSDEDDNSSQESEIERKSVKSKRGEKTKKRQVETLEQN